MKRIYSLILLALFMFGCSTGYDVQWEENGNEVIIQIDHVNPNIDMYYAEVTLESGSRIAVKLGSPDKEGKFRIKNTFGKFRNISIYTDSDLEGE